ncbi:MAG: ABC transporter permease [Dethiobacter sp.]|jgi:putative ABC transport system permease protein|nr:ABC transporter permease [Dethiobacter sp.]
MDLYTIAFNNLKRRKVKAFLIAFGLIVGVSSVVALLGIVQGMRLELGDRLDEFGANIVIMPRAEEALLTYGGGHTVDVAFNTEILTEDDLLKIDTIPERQSINIIHPKLVGAVNVDSRNVLIAGGDTRLEFSLKPWFSLAEQAGSTGGKVADLGLFELPENGVLLGAAAARSLRKSAGNEILLNNERFFVYGVLNPSGAQEDGLIFISLASAQHLLGRPGELSMIEIAAYCNFCPIEEAVAQLSDVLPGTRVTALRQAALIREETIARFYSFGLALCGITLFVSALTVLVTTLTSVNERTREIGIFRAIGFRSSHIATIVILETVIISFASGVMGNLAGFTLARVFGPYLVKMQVTIPWSTDMLALSVLLSVALAILACIYPAVKAAKLDPAVALRFI